MDATIDDSLVKKIKLTVINTRAKCPLIDKMMMLLFIDCRSLPGNLCPIIDNFHFLSCWLSVIGHSCLVLFGLRFCRMHDTRDHRLTGFYSNHNTFIRVHKVIRTNWHDTVQYYLFLYEEFISLSNHVKTCRYY